MEDDLIKAHQSLPTLNIETANTNSNSVDQTPTPTRFIKNCEEVGLFQDLQNVNPFEEVFKKAVSGTNTLQTNSLKIPSDDTTLHTPHVFPIDEHVLTRKYESIRSREDEGFNLTDTLVVELDTNNLNVTKQSAGEVISIEKKVDLNQIKNKLKSKIIANESNNAKKKITLRIYDKSPKEPEVQFSKEKNITDEVLLERQREMNRMAQIRCRKRRQMRISNMEVENNNLREQNKRLRMEAESLKKEVRSLQRIIQKYENERNNVPSEDPLRMDSIIPESPTPKLVISNNSIRIPIPILPKPVITPLISLTNGKFSVALSNSKSKKDKL